MMRSIGRLGFVAGVVGFLCLQAQVLAQETAEAEKPKYIGVANCGKCHKSKTKGNQLGQWQTSQHAKAYEALATPEAKEVAAKVDKSITEPQKSDKCLKCHVTAHGVDAALIAPIPEGKKGHSIEDGVGCESCHGPGSLYKSRKIMKDREAALANGLVIPTEETCKKCHNEESPTYKEFKFEEMFEKVKHPNPQKAAPKGEG